MEHARIFKAASNLFIGNAGSVLISLVNMMILTRILTTEEMGRYSLFLMVVTLALTIGLNWSDASIVRHGREEFVKHKKINQSFWARAYLFIPILFFIILILVIFDNPITAYIGIEKSLIILVVGMFVLNGLVNLITGVLQSIDQMKKSAYVLFVQKLIYLGGLLLLLFNAFHTKLSIILLLINISFLLTLVVYSLRFDFKTILPYKFNKKYLKKIWAFSWPQLFGFSGIYVIHYIDLFVIRKYLGLTDVGVYSVAYSGFLIIQGMLLLINTVFMPLIVEYKARKKFNLIKAYIKKIPLMLFSWTALALMGMLLSRFFIPLIFSSKYIASIPSFNVLLIASIFFIGTACLIAIMNAFDFIIHLQVINLITAALNVIGDFILVPKMGIIGAAYATMIALFLSLVLKIIVVFAKRNVVLGVASHDN